MFLRITSGVEESVSTVAEVFSASAGVFGRRSAVPVARDEPVERGVQGAALPVFELQDMSAMPNAETISHVSFAGFDQKFLLARKTVL